MHALAGKPAPQDLLIDVDALRTAYYDAQPDPDSPDEQVSFGTSGHRGSPLARTFNEAHVLAMAQAVCDYRRHAGIAGPLYIGMDTHAISQQAHDTAVEVLAANGVEVQVAKGERYTPTPVISHAILSYNRNHTTGLADGIVITPSHNPPKDGGFKYNPPNGGPADTDVTGWIEQRANVLLKAGNREVRRLSLDQALSLSSTGHHDYVSHYVADLERIIDMEVIAKAGLRLGVDPLGGAGVGYWAPIAERYGLDVTVVNDKVDPTFGFMHVDKDGQIRMDCSSPYAMAGLIAMRDKFDLAFGNDPDNDRHGIVTKSNGLMNPNHYLAVAVDYLFKNRRFDPRATIGKTLVSSAMIDRVAAALGRPVYEVPVGFKWFVSGLLGGSLAFAGEESAGASFLRKDGSAHSTDKDGFILNLLAAEILARTDMDPGEHYEALTKIHGRPAYTRIDTKATKSEKAALKGLSPAALEGKTLAGDPITVVSTRAKGNGATIGGIKAETSRGWFAARPSGTEDVCKLYAESFDGEGHLGELIEGAQALLKEAVSG